MRLARSYRLGIPALAMAQGISEAGFVLAAREGMRGGDSPVIVAALFVCVLLRFIFQDRGAALESRALRDATGTLRDRLLRAVRDRAVPAYRAATRDALDRALGESAPRAAEGLIAKLRFQGAVSQILLFLPLLLILSWKIAALGVGFAALVWPVLRWRNRRLKALEAEGRQGHGQALRALEDFGESLEARAGAGFGAGVDDLAIRLDAAHRPEWKWRRAQARYPAALETAFFFALSALLLAGSFILPDWNGMLLFSLMLVLAYRPVREAARHWPTVLAGARAQEDAEALVRSWEALPTRRAPEAHRGNALALRKANFAYEADAPILKDFSAEFAPKGITGVTGPNGAGKTTMLRLLAGAEIPADGNVLWPEGLRADGIAYLPQRVWPGLDWNAWAAKLEAERPEFWHELDALLSLRRIAARDAHPTARSGGERQRMCLARALASNARFLLLDEPVTALPADEREPVLRGALELWKREGRGAIVVSHEPFLPALCDTVIRMGG
jgi:ABC-type Mn2+/Zn2+ transport system ATPase subunit